MLPLQDYFSSRMSFQGKEKEWGLDALVYDQYPIRTESFITPVCGLEGWMLLAHSWTFPSGMSSVERARFCTTFLPGTARSKNWLLGLGEGKVLICFLKGHFSFHTHHTQTEGWTKLFIMLKKSCGDSHKGRTVFGIFNGTNHTQKEFDLQYIISKEALFSTLSLFIFLYHILCCDYCLFFFIHSAASSWYLYDVLIHESLY